MGYQNRAFCVGIKSENIYFIVHFDTFIHRICSILTEEKLIFVHTIYKQMQQPSHYIQTPHTNYQQTTKAKQQSSHHFCLCDSHQNCLFNAIHVQLVSLVDQWCKIVLYVIVCVFAHFEFVSILINLVPYVYDESSSNKNASTTTTCNTPKNNCQFSTC